MTGDAARRQPEAGPHFQQLYYTSCEQGLSGFSGFQFNAVSEGVTADTRQAVEALAGYEPPRSMVESDTPELLDRCPVNLCYRPHDPRGRSGTALCVRYAGRDSARRFGNYFAHALHSEDFPAAGRGLLGIELWGSPVWTARTSPTTRLPVLTAPPRGPLAPRTVRGFLDAHPHAEQLPHLLAAAFTALTEHGSVVVVDRTTERIAHWFAAVCYLLPPPLARPPPLLHHLRLPPGPQQTAPDRHGARGTARLRAGRGGRLHRLRLLPRPVPRRRARRTGRARPGRAAHPDRRHSRAAGLGLDQGLRARRRGEPRRLARARRRGRVLGRGRPRRRRRRRAAGVAARSRASGPARRTDRRGPPPQAPEPGRQPAAPAQRRRASRRRHRTAPGDRGEAAGVPHAGPYDRRRGRDGARAPHRPGPPRTGHRAVGAPAAGRGGHHPPPGAAAALGAQARGWRRERTSSSARRSPRPAPCWAPRRRGPHSGGRWSCSSPPSPG